MSNWSVLTPLLSRVEADREAQAIMRADPAIKPYVLNQGHERFHVAVRAEGHHPSSPQSP